MRVIAEPVQSKDLKPGDLYSEHNQEWWDNRDSTSIGHFVIIRNSNPFPEGYHGNVSYKITIHQDDDDWKVNSDIKEIPTKEDPHTEEASDDTTLITG